MRQDSDAIVEAFLNDISSLTEADWSAIHTYAVMAKRVLARADTVMLSTSLQDSKRFLSTASAEKIALNLATKTATNERADAIFERLAAAAQDERLTDEARGRLRVLVQHVLRLFWCLPSVEGDEKSQQAGRDELRPFAGFVSPDLIPPYLRE